MNGERLEKKAKLFVVRAVTEWVADGINGWGIGHAKAVSPTSS